MRQGLILILRFYQRTISIWLPPRCRFHPSCSHYAIEALQKYGAAQGCWLVTKRICRCHPLNPGGYDPVP